MHVDLSWSLGGVVLTGFNSDDVILLDSSSSSTGARLVVGIPARDSAPKAWLEISCSTGPSRLSLQFSIEANAVTVTVEEQSYGGR